ncbi:MAG: hypothetical protein IPQ00_18000 [Chloracidobacterium sp.]|nr:hypothetical protein [Chloracidobacterium sp.]
MPFLDPAAVSGDPGAGKAARDNSSGLTGSELINSRTNEVVWFKAPRSKDDDLRLPITANVLKSQDSLVRGDILRSIKIGIFPRIDVYGGLIRSTYRQGRLPRRVVGNPTTDGDKASIYVFPLTIGERITSKCGC